VATKKVLIMGASYGSLLASKLLFGGHEVTLICLPAEVDAINSDGIRVRLPIRGRASPVEIHSKKLPGKISAAGPAGIDPNN
jgi:ketopantoate reductase